MMIPIPFEAIDVIGNGSPWPSKGLVALYGGSWLDRLTGRAGAAFR